MTPLTGIPFPAQNDSIRLDKVNVVLTVTGWEEGLRARCEFLFQNTTDTEQETLMGFPVANVSSSVGEGGIGIWGLDRFEVKIGLVGLDSVLVGEPVTFRSKTSTLSHYRIKSGPTRQERFKHVERYDKQDIVRDGFNVKHLTTIYWSYRFAPKESQRFVVEYEVKSPRGIAYVIGTAATWKGGARDMVITVKYPDKTPLHMLEASPAGFEYSADAIRWRFNDYNAGLVSAADTVSLKRIDGYREYDMENIPSDYFKPRKVEASDFRWDRYYVQRAPVELMRGYNDLMIVRSPDLYVRELSQMRNEIFARHGYRFTTPFYQECFGKMPWYRERQDFSEKEFNYIERRNVRYLKCIEDGVKKLPQAFEGYFALFGKNVPAEGCHGTGKVLIYQCNSEKRHDDEGNELPDQERKETYAQCRALDERYYNMEANYLKVVEDCSENNPY